MIDITKTYRTRDGRNVRLISDKGSEMFPIIGIVDGNHCPLGWTREGSCNSPACYVSDYDLVEVPPQVTRCITVFKNESLDVSYVSVLTRAPCEANEPDRIGEIRIVIEGDKLISAEVMP